MKVDQLYFDDLTEAEKKDIPNNGCGKEYASYLKITHGGETIGLHSDAMEPEDCAFCRDLSWVKKALENSYAIGLSDGQKTGWISVDD